MLYDHSKKPKTQEKVKKLIRESIDNFHSTLVSDCKVSISLAVFGPLGAGKSFFLNFLLNLGLGERSVPNGPLSICTWRQPDANSYLCQIWEAVTSVTAQRGERGCMGTA